MDGVPTIPGPRAELEQYRTPTRVATDLLLAAHADGAIEGRRVLDLGCGTGLFAIGAALLGARQATGVEVHPDAIRLANAAATVAGVAQKTWFVASDIASWRADPGLFDTVIMNPPFGAQKGNKHADRLFLERAEQAVRPNGTVWFLALERTEGFLGTFAKSLGASIDRVGAWDYPLVATMAHHEKEAQLVRVGGYRLAWTS